MRVTIDGQCGNLWAQISLTVDRLQNSVRASRNYDVTDKYLFAASIPFHPFHRSLSQPAGPSGETVKRCTIAACDSAKVP